MMSSCVARTCFCPSPVMQTQRGPNKPAVVIHELCPKSKILWPPTNLIRQIADSLYRYIMEPSGSASNSTPDETSGKSISPASFVGSAISHELGTVPGSAG